MARGPLPETEILKKKVEPAEEIDKAIIKTIADLRAAIKTAQDKRICELSRALADEVDHAFTHPELWLTARVEEVHSLLQDAARATIGTEYEENCAARPGELKGRLETLLRARKVVQQSLKV
jgi:hypothetical protein